MRLHKAVMLPLALLIVSLAGPSARADGINVAVVDISHIFKNHSRFKSTADSIKANIKSFEQEMTQRRAALTEKGQKLDQFNQGTPQFKALEAELAQQAAAMKLEADRKRRDVLELEAKAYYDTYQEVQRAIATVAAKYNIALVLRYNSQPIDPNDRADVLRGVNQAIIYHNKLDITSQVMQALGINPNVSQVNGPAAR
ncbi:MAG: OmpH family outer membrane protein [Pirellulaceae bacterium]|jgi:Skp family chaperone for outer membrane proteins|nr:OmpH family outer membrane protein [Pirellulaceae bacterium]MDP7019342.1 OmpH family outer membrane protein [Pirellulaceae bacterium]